MSSRGKRRIVATLVVVAVVLGFLNTLPRKPTRRQIIGTPALQADANDLASTIVTPHMAIPLEPDKNVLWCATFQMAWNELADLKIPVLSFDILESYDDLVSDGWAAPHIRFKLDETGTVLKSQGAAVSAVDREREEPVDLIFDRDFLIVLQRREAANPYFALWVANAELLVPVEKKP